MSDFGSQTTTDEVLAGADLTGRRVLITGAAVGLGRECARALAAHGADVTILARSAERADEGVAAVSALFPDAAGRLHAGVVDLGDLGSIRAFAEGWLADHDAFDVLINNAGVMACPFGHTADGFETQFGTNHLGHFLLTVLLLPALLRGDAPRVVTLSSAAHSRCDVDLDDPGFERTEYSAWDAYGRSKSANALFARELARRAGPQGLLSYSVHPGAIITDLGRHLTEDLMNEMMETAAERAEEHGIAGGIVWKSVEAGAATQTWAATSTDAGLLADNGAYLADCGLGVLGANPGENGLAPWILDDATAAALWALSEELVGAASPV
ncbi:MAG TPA: SDR family NAD(P)-dependent oxidoreductase [Acidimicrobiales bacterium]|nr:SDR family NAD(P)-dependent oxidoreductase [Acidimicrobiales bacterium]